MAEQEWIEPKIDFIATDQVTPSIFNTLGKDTKYLNEVKSGIQYEHPGGDTITISTLVFVEE